MFLFVSKINGSGSGPITDTYALALTALVNASVSIFMFLTALNQKFANLVIEKSKKDLFDSLDFIIVGAATGIISIFAIFNVIYNWMIIKS